MTKVKVEPGICGLTAVITADSEDGMEAEVHVETRCKMIREMADGLGETLNAYELLMPSPGQERCLPAITAKYPTHASCPVLAGLLKCVEAECGLALKKDASITFIED